MKTQILSVNEAGRKGGQKTASLHGKKHFSKAGKKGAAKRWKEKPKPNLV